MADKSIKQPENVSGKYYVDQTCVPCNDCVKEAPNLLKYSADETHTYFAKQPSTPEEEKWAKAAMAVCPVDAIGNDG